MNPFFYELVRNCATYSDTIPMLFIHMIPRHDLRILLAEYHRLVRITFHINPIEGLNVSQAKYFLANIEYQNILTKGKFLFHAIQREAIIPEFFNVHGRQVKKKARTSKPDIYYSLKDAISLTDSFQPDHVSKSADPNCQVNRITLQVFVIVCACYVKPCSDGRLHFFFHIQVVVRHKL